MQQPNTARKRRLEEELQEDGVPALTPEALEEVYYARYAPVHEARQPRYGAIIARPSASELAQVANQLLLLDERRWKGSSLTQLRLEDLSAFPLSLARRFANGTHNFLCRDHSGHYLWSSSGVSESALSHMAQQLDATIVQRLGGGGVVRIYHQYGIATWDGSRWVPKPYAASYEDMVATAIASIDSRADYDVTRAILDLCVHTLSAANVGATIVWDRTHQEAEFEDIDFEPMRAIDVEHAVALPPLSLLDADTHPAIASLLSQYDRALLVRDNGHLSMVGVTLAPTAGSSRTRGGTRHNSAIAFSNEEPHTVVFVVSQDGPVSVFRRGVCVASNTDGFHLVAGYTTCNSCAPATTADGGMVPGDPHCEDCEGTGRVLDDMEILPISHQDFHDKGDAWTDFPSRSVDWAL